MKQIVEPSQQQASTNQVHYGDRRDLTVLGRTCVQERGQQARSRQLLEGNPYNPPPER